MFTRKRLCTIFSAWQSPPCYCWCLHIMCMSVCFLLLLFLLCVSLSPFSLYPPNTCERHGSWVARAQQHMLVFVRCRRRFSLSFVKFTVLFDMLGIFHFLYIQEYMFHFDFDYYYRRISIQEQNKKKPNFFCSVCIEISEIDFWYFVPLIMRCSVSSKALCYFNAGNFVGTVEPTKMVHVQRNKQLFLRASLV